MSWFFPSNVWVGVGSRLIYGRNQMQFQVSLVHGPRIVLSMFITLPVASDRILTWMRLEFHIKQTSQRSPEENWNRLGRRNTEAGFGRDRTKTYLRGGADPGNVVTIAQTYNQHRGVAHTAAMPEGLSEFFIRIASPEGGIVIDPFAGGGTTIVVARRLGRKAAGFEIHEHFVDECRRRIAEDSALDIQGYLFKVG